MRNAFVKVILVVGSLLILGTVTQITASMQLEWLNAVLGFCWLGWLFYAVYEGLGLPMPKNVHIVKEVVDYQTYERPYWGYSYDEVADIVDIATQRVAEAYQFGAQQQAISYEKMLDRQENTHKYYVDRITMAYEMANNENKLLIDRLFKALPSRSQTNLVKLMDLPGTDITIQDVGQVVEADYRIIQDYPTMTAVVKQEDKVLARLSVQEANLWATLHHGAPLIV
jgi:hypothetical protein